MKITVKNTPHHIVRKFHAVSKTDRFEYASTEEALASAEKIMNIYDEVFEELAK